jgi:hypothetical protein
MGDEGDPIPRRGTTGLKDPPHGVIGVGARLTPLLVTSSQWFAVWPSANGRKPLVMETSFEDYQIG